MGQNIKEQLLEKLKLESRQIIYNYKRILNDLQEAKSNETKSSVGDKYETGRTMLQIEEEKMKTQLNNAQSQNQLIELIDPKEEHDKSQFGSLVFTNKGNYFVSIAFGKMTINNVSYYCISTGSPIAQLILGLVAKDIFHFNNQEFKIEKVL